jgi:thymidine phosphorylase
MLATEIIRSKRDHARLSAPQVQAFVRGLVDGSWSEGQVAALAMAILLNGMDRAECVALTHAMTHSGQVLRWPKGAGARPVVDKHSTGGVGDKVSLVLAPIVAACGGLVPMLSGRGLGHTGGTLDKLQALPGYEVAPSRVRLLRVLQSAGCAIVGASDDLAPADRRLYAVRDVTATVESVPLITASILSKKLAAGLGSLVMDVKVGNGAFMTGLADAQALARSLVEVAAGAGLPCRALITDMNQVLGHSAGNALEVAESLAFLTGAERDPRLLALSLALAAQMLLGAGLAASVADAEAMAASALSSGRAAECFARMVAGLGGPPDVLADARLPGAPVIADVPAPGDGVLVAMNTRAVGLAVVALGGGRRRAGDPVDPRVGFDQVRPLGSVLRAGEPLARVHAATAADAAAGVAALQAAVTLQPPGAAGFTATPLILDTLGPAA